MHYIITYTPQWWEKYLSKCNLIFNILVHDIYTDRLPLNDNSAVLIFYLVSVMSFSFIILNISIYNSVTLPLWGFIYSFVFEVPYLDLYASNIDIKIWCMHLIVHALRQSYVEVLQCPFWSQAQLWSTSFKVYNVNGTQVHRISVFLFFKTCFFVCF